jgi:hypothetical protein
MSKATKPVVYCTPGLDAWSLSNESERLYRKELIYEGAFVKKDDSEEIRFNVDEALMLHWVATHDAMTANGNDVPLPLMHTENPEQRRGTVHRLAVEEDSQGRKGLFGYIKFRDAEAEKLAASNVSIYVPNEWTDGKDNRYVRPVRHVALTDYPVVPGLDSFQAIVASLSLAQGDQDMPLRQLATKLGVELGDDTADDQVESKIVTAITTMKTENSKLKQELATLKAKPKPESKEGEGKEEEKKVAVAAGFITLARDNRKMKLDGLVGKSAITKAVADKLSEQYCTDEALSLSLSSDGTSSDGFDNLIETLSGNDPVKLGEASGQQTVALSHNLKKGEENPVLKDAQARADAAKS